MRDGERPADLIEQRRHVLDRERPRSVELGAQGPAAHVLHHQVGARGVAPGVVNGDDVRCLQPEVSGHLRFEAKALERDLGGVSARAGREKLHRDFGVEREVMSRPHLTHPAPAELPKEAIARRDDRAGSVRRSRLHGTLPHHASLVVLGRAPAHEGVRERIARREERAARARGRSIVTAPCTVASDAIDRAGGFAGFLRGISRLSCVAVRDGPAHDPCGRRASDSDGLRVPGQR